MWYKFRRLNKKTVSKMAAFVEPHYSALWQGQSGHGNLTVVDKVPPEMLYLVDAHWYQFPPMNPLWHSILGFAIFVLGCISIIGNGVVIYVSEKRNCFLLHWLKNWSTDIYIDQEPPYSLKSFGCQFSCVWLFGKNFYG